MFMRRPLIQKCILIALFTLDLGIYASSMAPVSSSIAGLSESITADCVNSRAVVYNPGGLGLLRTWEAEISHLPWIFNTAFEQVPDLLTHTTYYRGFQCWSPVVMAADAGLFMAEAIA